MITLLIKGTQREAEAALQARSLQYEILYEASRGETLVKVPSYAGNAVRLWYGEPPGAPPFPPGTLLHFTETVDKGDPAHG